MAKNDYSAVFDAFEEERLGYVLSWLENQQMDDYPEIVQLWSKKLGNSFPEVMGNFFAHLIKKDPRFQDEVEPVPFPTFWKKWQWELEMDDLYIRLASQPDEIEENIVWIAHQPDINIVGEIWPLLQHTIGRITTR